MRRAGSLLALVAELVRLSARRIWVRRRLTAGLLAGFVLAVAATSSLPPFAAGVLQRVLQMELRAVPKRQPAAVHLAHFEHPRRPTRAADFAAADAVARELGPELIGLSISPLVRYGALEPTRVRPVDPGRMSPRERWLILAFLSELDRHAQVVDGRLPRPGRTADGFYEAMVEVPALDRQDFTVGAELLVPLGKSARAPAVPVRVVGAFERREPEQPYWFQGGFYDQHLFVQEATFREEILPRKGVSSGQYSWYYGVDAAQITITGVVPLLAGLYELEARAAQALPDTQLFEGPMELLTRYAYQAADLRRLLVLLLVPALAVVGYFLVVTSGLMVEGQRQEIAMLRSRGAGLGQVVGIYLLEGLLLAALALALGYPLGALLARGMGAISGFLAVVRRSQPPLLIDAEFWLYGGAAAALGVLAYVLPVLPAARESIVTFKQESARRLRRPLWSRFGLDFLLLGLAGYAYYTLLNRYGGPGGLRGAAGAGAPGAVAGVAGAGAGAGAVAGTAGAVAGAGAGVGGWGGAGLAPLDPLQVLAPFLLILGAGLILLRLMPYLAQALSRLAEGRAPVPLYLALVQLSRAPGSHTPVVLLLVVTVATGLYSATAARTLERNLVDRIRYAGGADAVLEEVWPYIDHSPPADPERPGVAEPRQIEYLPPPWHLHYDLPEVEHPARVRVQAVTPSVGGRSQRQGTLMAVDAHDFGQVAWLRRDLAPVDLNGYMHLLAARPEAALVSRRFMERHNLQPGDGITLTDDRGQAVFLIIHAPVDYWPGLYPDEGDFFVANLEYIEQELGVRPHQVWLRLEPGARLQPVIDALKAQEIITLRAVDQRQRLIQARRAPQYHGLMGGLSAGFVVAAAVTVLGFWFHAALSARARVVQFGVLRAMGLARRQLATALALEQVAVVGAGVAAGTGLGRLAAELFIPFLQWATDALARTPPFVIAGAGTDQVRLYLLLLLMLAAAVAALAVALGRMRIYEAVRLGEDQ